jgi:hypothetical protein
VVLPPLPLDVTHRVLLPPSLRNTHPFDKYLSGAIRIQAPLG